MLWLIAGLALVVGAAACFAALGRPRGAAAFVLVVYVFSAAEIVAVSALLSVVDRYTRTGLLAGTALVAGVAVGLVVWRRPPRPPLPVGDALRLLGADPVLTTLAAVVAAALAYELALALFVPMNDGDGLQYHLTRAALWRQQHAIGYVPGAEDLRINAFPPGAEILTAFTMTLSASVRWVGLVQYTAMLGTAVAVFGIARRTGLDRRRAAYGALLFLTLPIVALQASSSSRRGRQRRRLRSSAARVSTSRSSRSRPRSSWPRRSRGSSRSRCSSRSRSSSGPRGSARSSPPRSAGSWARRGTS
jgi:hypothetical protein